MDNLLATFLNFHGFVVIQQNGQRIVCQKGSENGPTHHEIFLSQLPKEFNENHIIQYLMEFPDIYKIRIMMSFNGDCRGFGYVDFKEKSSSIKACAVLDRLQIGNRIIRCTLSDEDCRVIYIAFNWRIVRILDIIWELLQEIGDISDGKTGIEKITVHDTDPHGLVHCFIKFNEHGKAATARKHLRNINKTAFYNAYFDWKKRCCIYNELPPILLELYPNADNVLECPETKLVDIQKCVDYCDLNVILV